MSDNEISLHDKVKRQILIACNSLGFQAKEEYKGNGWRADVFVLGNDTKYAFEVQITKQSLKKTLERQEKYIKDGIIGCWLFEKEPAKLKNERADLPLFKINNIESQINISLKERKELPLDVFIGDYLQNKIKFCQTLDILPKIEVTFVEMYCWKCGLENHIWASLKKA
jgi:competence CoiA-like predicted nuclease